MSAVAGINGIRVLDQYDGTWYEVYPEGIMPQCHRGRGVWVDLGLVNVGSGEGEVYVIVEDTVTSAELYRKAENLSPSEVTFCSFGFNMPSTDVTLAFKIGRIEGGGEVEEQSGSITFTAVGEPPSQPTVWLLVGLGAVAFGLISFGLISRKETPKN